MLKVSNLTVRYGSITAVQDISLEVNNGEIVAIVGANGAGKTTTLMSIAGAVRPTTGEITFMGRPITTNRTYQTVAQGISLVPEGRRILCGLTLRQNLLLGTTTRRDKTKALSDIEEILERFPILKSRCDQLAASLSGGEQQMLAFARALASRPKLLLCDEPSLGLSPILTDEVFAVLNELHNEGLPILLVEQFAKRAVATAERTYVMSRGVIAFSGTREEFMANRDWENVYFGIKQ